MGSSVRYHALPAAWQLGVLGGDWPGQHCVESVPSPGATACLS